ncbi:hypothetical protein [Jiulongibacter sp. NS-SX5]|uniref:hypothetical protein n=1 Tax=Jiulongibacter sp. NS-SX5 TaxID=3463854 RepID=UPI00405894C9
MEKQLTNNLSISNDAVEVIDFMTDKQILPKSFDQSYTTTLIDGKDLYLILYIKKEEEDEFIKFTFSDFTSHPDSMEYLHGVLKGLARDEYDLYTPAKNKLEEMIYMRPVFHAFYHPKAA